MKKKLVLLAFLSMMGLKAIYAQVKTVGEIVDGQPTLTMDKSEMLKKYSENLLKATGIDGQFTDVSIRSAGNNNYVLFFTGKNCRSSMMLINTAGKFAPSGTTCTTSDCSSEPHGCEVTYGTGPDAGTVYCSPCGNGGKCTKTTSTISLLD